MALPRVWLDGALVAPDEARISVLSHAIQRGAAVFDVGVLRPGDRGPLLFRPADHVSRFLRSTAAIGPGIDPLLDAETLLRATVETARASGATSALVRWTAFIADAEPDVVPRSGARASVAIAILPDDPAATAKPATVRVSVPRDARKAGPEVFPPHAKVAASYLGPMLAKRRAREQGYDEVVLLDGEGHLAEAPTANVFIVRAGVLHTPPLGRILPGITRDSALAIARAEAIPVHEAPLGLEDLAAADEAFLTASSFPVQGISAVDGRPLRAAAPVTARMRSMLLACERGEDPRFASWVVPVR
ncbi:MAG TPA: aminotransferase class IV [Polyangiaceae bacterium]|jgi:branched-chain amino acid aminotransferase